MRENASVEGQIIEAIYIIRNKSRRPDEDAIFICIVKNLTTNITFQDIAEQVEGMIKSERVENRQTAQELVSFFVTDINDKVPSNTPKGSGECSNVVCNSGGLPKDQNSFLQETTVISKQLDSTPNTDKLNEFAAQIAAMKAIFLDEIHELK